MMRSSCHARWQIHSHSCRWVAGAGSVADTLGSALRPAKADRRASHTQAPSLIPPPPHPQTPPPPQAAARHIAEVSNECKVPVDADDYVESFRPTLMDVVYRWSQGTGFGEVGGWVGVGGVEGGGVGER